MFSSPAAGRSVDHLSPLSPGARHEYPLHSNRGRPTSRRSSTASSVRSVGGMLDSSSSSWTNSLHESGQNAISTLLQPPIVRTGLQPHATAPTSTAHKPPTARDIPPVTLTNISHVEASEFTPYMTQFGALYDQLRRVRESDADNASTWRAGRQGDQDDADSGDGFLRPSPSMRRGRKGSNASLSSLNSTDAPSPARRSSSGFARKSVQGPPPLSTIPNVYFDEDFHLENPRTFDVVSEKSEVIRPSQSLADDQGEGNGVAAAPRKALATNAILQEKLSWYMDTIEVHLINSISTASTTFFTALGSLKELHSETADSVQRIKSLRMELEALDKEIVKSGLDIVKKRRRQENLRQLNDAIQQLKHIVDGVGYCESLVDDGEVNKALDSMKSLEKLIAGEREDSSDVAESVQLRDLRGASSLQGVDADLVTLRFRIGKTYEAQFANVLLGDLREHIESVSSSDVLLRWSNAASRGRGAHNRTSSVFPSYLANTEELKKKLLPTMMGLHRAQHVGAAATAYRESVLREIKNLIRRPLPSSNDDDNESMMSASTASGGRGRSSQEKSSVLARNLRALGPDDAEELLATIYIRVTETLRRLTTQSKVILDIASSLTETSDSNGAKTPNLRSPLASPQPDRHGGNPTTAVIELQEEMHMALDVANLLGQAVDIANEKIVKILRVRSEQVASLPLDFFLRYFTLNLYFANECEAISGRSGTPLKNVVNNHIKDFVQKTRDAEMQKLAHGMESEPWDAKDFSDKNGRLLEHVIESSTHDCEAWMERTKIWTPYYEIEKAERESETKPPETNGSSKDKGRSAVIDSQKFVLPYSAILCMEGMANFLHLILGIPSMTTDIASSLIAYLQLFNSRCTQLILGAGAMRSAGLKNITSKHLALASQALSFVYTLVPHVREFVRRHAGSGAGVSSLMGEFDKVRRLLQEHQDSIHQKLVDIMSGRVAMRVRTMNEIDWDAGGASVHPYMETLAKETSTLYRVLTKHLPETSIEMIMGPVFSSYKEQLGKALGEADLKTKAGQDSMMMDVEFFTTKLSKITGFGDAGEALANIVKSKEVEEEQAPTSPTNEGDDESKVAKEDGDGDEEGEKKETPGDSVESDKPGEEENKEENKEDKEKDKKAVS